MKSARPVMIGPLPPPVGGAARVTAAICSATRRRGGRVIVLDTSTDKLSHNRTPAYHARRSLRTALLVAVLLGLSLRRRKVYLVPDGGFGVWYSLALVVVARLRCTDLILHHHTCRYVEHHDRAMSQITRRTRHLAEHVFLTPGMADEFQQRYGPVRHRVVGNAAFTEPTAPEPREPVPGPLVLGHLSNLCREKGFFEVLAAFESLVSHDGDVRLVLAGPVLEDEVERCLADLLQRRGERVDYLGPVAGRAKQDFYDGIDVFLFPTQFSQEAAPNVLYEAAASGTPSIAVSRGRIAEIIAELGGWVCAPDADFSARVHEVLSSGDRADRAALRTEVRAAFETVHERELRNLESFVDELSGSVPGGTGRSVGR